MVAGGVNSAKLKPSAGMNSLRRPRLAGFTMMRWLLSSSTFLLLLLRTFAVLEQSASHVVVLRGILKRVRNDAVARLDACSTACARRLDWALRSDALLLVLLMVPSCRPLVAVHSCSPLLREQPSHCSWAALLHGGECTAKRNTVLNCMPSMPSSILQMKPEMRISR